MGIDLKAGGRKTKATREVKSDNIYLRLLMQLYSFLARKTTSKFNKIVLHRLSQSRENKRPMNLGRLQKNLTGKEDQIAVVVGTITNDARIMEVNKGIKVCALHVTETARKRIEENGGKVYTFDQLATISPEGKGTVLLRGRRWVEKKKHFGVPGAAGQHVKPHTRGQKGRKVEKARGRRKSRGFKVKNNLTNRFKLKDKYKITFLFQKFFILFL
jgi:large subunit ribosomal protein L18e